MGASGAIRALGGVAAVLALVAPASATAGGGPAVRYAEVGGNGPAGTCPLADPCQVQDAIENAAADPGDEIVLLPGTYDVGANPLVIDQALVVHGQDGQARPTITGTAENLVEVSDVGALVRDLTITSNAPTGGVLLFSGGGGAGERIDANGTSSGSACRFTTGAILRDSICRNSGGGAGVTMSVSAGTHTTYLVNVTAMPSSMAALARAVQLLTTGTAIADLQLHNTIAVTPSASPDVSAGAGAGSFASVTATNSNYQTAGLNMSGGTESVTAPGSGTNQTAAPLVANVAGGDLHQVAGSPTINAGTGHVYLGTLDIDRGARTVGPAPDIGADEFVPPTPVTPTPPAAVKKCKKGQKLKKIKGKKRCVKKKKKKK